MAAIVEKLKGGKPFKAGEKVSSSEVVKEGSPMEPHKFALADLPGKNLIVGVPGAFTAPCSAQLPGFVNNADKFAAKGVAGIYVVAVNDLFVLNAWKEKLGSTSNLIHFVSDDTGKFSKSVGRGLDLTDLLGGHRSKRYVAVIDNGTVRNVFDEEDDTKSTVTQAENILQAL